MNRRKGFTLIEVLISIVLLGLMIPALYTSVDMLRSSNKDLYRHLQKSKKEALAIETLYLDIASSDGNLTIRNDDFDRLCINATQNSLYGLSSPKVCWVVLKEGHDLVRIEGYDYSLPLKMNDIVEADTVIKGVGLFDIYWDKDKVLVMLGEKNMAPVSFMVQGITKPKKRPTRRPKKQSNSKSAPVKTPSGSRTPPAPRTPNSPEPSPLR